jgi:hypothetical protein
MDARVFWFWEKLKQGWIFQALRRCVELGKKVEIICCQTNRRSLKPNPNTNPNE